MDIEIIIGCDMHPQQVAEFAVEAEKAGVRAAADIILRNSRGAFYRMWRAAV